MKPCFIILCLVVFNADRLPGQELGNISPLPRNENEALRMLIKNSQTNWPDLNYWGFDGYEWGENRDVNATARKVTANSKQFCELSCQQEVISDVPSNGVNRIQYSFAAGLTNREERVRLYHVLQDELLKAYQSPTHAIKSDEVFRGKDGYVQGLDKEYRLEWHGLETIVCLSLSDQSLFIECRQAPTSKANEMRQQIKRAKQMKESAELEGLSRSPNIHERVK